MLVGCAAACTSFGADDTSPPDASIAIDAAPSETAPDAAPDAAPEIDAATDARRIDPPRDGGRDAPARLHLAFLSSPVADPGGRDAADRVCAQEAAVATLAGTFLAFYAAAPVLMGGVGQPPEARVLPATRTWVWPSTAEVALRGSAPTQIEGNARGPNGDRVTDGLEVWVAWSPMGFRATSYAALPSLSRSGEGAGARRLLCFELL